MIQADGRDSPGYGERWLWCSVLMLAVGDLNSRNVRHATDARAWLFDQHHDRNLRRVCLLAGVDPDWLRAAVQRAGLVCGAQPAAA